MNTVAGLREALAFYDKALADPKGVEVGATRDGLDWVLQSARALVAGVSDITALQTDRDCLALLLGKLVRRLDEIHEDPAFKSVWMLHQLHAGPYRGPKYDQELEGARRYLKGVKTIDCPMCARLRAELADPPGDVQEAVLRKLGLWPYFGRKYHAGGMYWSGVPTVDLPCDFCGRGFMEHAPRTQACMDRTP